MVQKKILSKVDGVIAMAAEAAHRTPPGGAIGRGERCDGALWNHAFMCPLVRNNSEVSQNRCNVLVLAPRSCSMGETWLQICTHHFGLLAQYESISSNMQLLGKPSVLVAWGF